MLKARFTQKPRENLTNYEQAAKEIIIVLKMYPGTENDCLRLPTNAANTSEATVKLCPFPNSWRRSSKIPCSVSRKALKDQMKVKGYVLALISQDRLINKVRLFHFKIDLSQPLFKMSPESNFSLRAPGKTFWITSPKIHNQ